MRMWLYQMSQADPQGWSANRYRIKVWERQETTWPAGQIKPKNKSPEPGDLMALFFAPKRVEEDAGFYGWAVVTKWEPRSNRITFRPTPPSDMLKMSPWWNDDARRIVDDIRGPQPRGTMWLIPPKPAAQLRERLASFRAWNNSPRRHPGNSDLSHLSPESATQGSAKIME
jgi:hypothetical protein